MNIVLVDETLHASRIQRILADYRMTGLLEYYVKDSGIMVWFTLWYCEVLTGDRQRVESYLT